MQVEQIGPIIMNARTGSCLGKSRSYRVNTQAMAVTEVLLSVITHTEDGKLKSKYSQDSVIFFLHNRCLHVCFVMYTS